MKASLEDLVQKQERRSPGFMYCPSEMAVAQERGMPAPSDSAADLVHPAAQPNTLKAKRLTFPPEFCFETLRVVDYRSGQFLNPLVC